MGRMPKVLRPSLAHHAQSKRQRTGAVQDLADLPAPLTVAGVLSAASGLRAGDGPRSFQNLPPTESVAGERPLVYRTVPARNRSNE